MNTRLSLSIALASYNGERYISEQLDSIARQTRLPDELIISDDASNDATRAIVLDFAQRASFPVLLRTNSERLGSTRNFEVAIRACSGDIIFLCDQDDVWYPDKLAFIERRFLSNTGAGAVFTDGDVVDQDLHPLGVQLWKVFKFGLKNQARIAAGDALGVLLKRPVVTGATMAFRSIYRDLVLPLPNMWHDAWIALLIGAVSRLDTVRMPLIAYRQHGANQLGIPRRGRNRNKTCATIYGPQVSYYEAARTRLLEVGNRFPISEQKIRCLYEALIFLRARAALPDARWRRLTGTLHELVVLRYHRYAFGLSSFCKDLMR
ncbi:Glycosyl transferase family 2 [Nitrosospira sp. Nl5]|uniref:glycosyltransferase family 2 protein n=1 Tax=Nitrosospira sp. Nl5 TaxID=200120 RepID=UPI000892734E|nr:glycosyltransferase family 2 protein [Nitrosospira sp. Nl5]SCY25430.1 Glycosyl transferase family 2 [Nitrosospira sp. Nl5]